MQPSGFRRSGLTVNQTCFWIEQDIPDLAHQIRSLRKPEPIARLQDLDAVDAASTRVVHNDAVAEFLSAIHDLPWFTPEVDVHRVGLGIVRDLHGPVRWLKYT
jgi:hypothetical protein